MNNIAFPNLGLSFNISKIAISFMGIDIYWYSICIVLGIVIALILAKISKENYDIEFLDLLDVVFWGLIFGIIGARAYFVLFNLEYYLENPVEILSIRSGGLGIYGGLILGGIVAYFRAQKLNIKFLDLLDYIVPFVAIAQSIGRWGNFFNVEAYGEETDTFLRMEIETIEGIKSVHPTFFYESISTFIIFVVLKILQKNRRYEGQIFLSYLVLYSFCRFFVEGLRADSLIFCGFRVSQLLSILIFIIAIKEILKREKLMKKRV